jgi:hypothetical protein
MTTIPTVFLDRDGNNKAFADRSTSESIFPLQTQLLLEDFINSNATIPTAGSPVIGYPWVKKLTLTSGSPTVGYVANALGGQVQLALDATNEAQEAALYANDQRAWDLSKGTVFEAVAALSVVPSVAGVEMVLGMQPAWISGPDNAAYYSRFQVNGSGLVNCQSKDGVNTFSVSSGVTLTAGVFNVFRIDLSDPTSVAYYINGVKVGGAGISFAATGANAVLQPYASMYKTASAGLGTMLLGSIKLASAKV